MEIKEEYGFNDLMNRCWSGAIDTLKTIENNGKENELLDYLKEIYTDKIPTITEINDFLWFESDTIFNNLDIEEEEEKAKIEEIRGY